jgi:endoglucanase
MSASKVARRVALCVVVSCVVPASSEAQPPAGYNAVKTNYILRNSDPGGWAGSATNGLEVTSLSSLPLDTAVTFNGLPSLRVNVQRRQTWWLAMIVPRGWATADIADYYANGRLEFNVRGNAGGEQFYVSLGDRAFERSVNGTLTESIKTPKRPISDFLTGGVTTGWQHVSIPLTALIPSASGFRLNALWTFEVSNVNGNALRFWLNEIKFTTSDKERQYPQIKVNQVGYTTVGEKYTTVTGWYENMTAIGAGTAFQVKRASDGAVVHTGSLALVTNYDPFVSGEKILSGDFSSLTTSGTYYVAVAGLADSPSFAIGNDVFDPLLRDSLRYYYLQRANLALVEPYAEGWAHPAWHPDDANAPLESTRRVKDNVSKGWYDAGDFGKYTSPSATAANDLLWTYEMFPSLFADGQLNIPESGNGTPDLLDEIRYELDFLLNMQDQASLGFWSRVFPQGKNDARFISDIAQGLTRVKPTAHSAAGVAALAHASVVLRALDPAYASTCLTAARNGWTYLQNNPGLVPAPSGPYYDDQDRNDRFWAAAELFRATGEAPYHDYFLANYQSFAAAFSASENAHGVGGMELSGFLAYLRAANRDAAAVAWITARFNEWRGYQLSRAQGAWRNTSDAATDYYWGSNAPMLYTSMDLVIGTKILGTYDASIARTVRSNLNYVLGINPLSLSYVSGYGTNSVQKIFSNIYSDDFKPGLPPGYLAGGSNQYEGSWFSRFTGKCYLDDDGEWTTNEHTIYWNAGLVFSAAFAVAESRMQP